MLIKNESVSLCLQTRKKKGSRKGNSVVPVDVVSVNGDHIIAIPRHKPGKRISIDANTKVSNLRTSTVYFNY